ncbi:M-phase inducer phosphatase 1 [Balamuthia mandrillaris]
MFEVCSQNALSPISKLAMDFTTMSTMEDLPSSSNKCSSSSADPEVNVCRNLFASGEEKKDQAIFKVPTAPSSKSHHTHHNHPSVLLTGAPPAVDAASSSSAKEEPTTPPENLLSRERSNSLKRKALRSPCPLFDEDSPSGFGKGLPQHNNHLALPTLLSCSVSTSSSDLHPNVNNNKSVDRHNMVEEDRSEQENRSPNVLISPYKPPSSSSKHKTSHSGDPEQQQERRFRRYTVATAGTQARPTKKLSCEAMRKSILSQRQLSASSSSIATTCSDSSSSSAAALARPSLTHSVDSSWFLAGRRNTSDSNNMMMPTLVLPTLAHASPSDLNCISPDTLVDLLEGRFSHRYDAVHIIDGRFGYEFDGGHIRGALNLSTQQEVKEKFMDEPSALGERVCIVFHCEFSSHRGPNLTRFLRSWDRKEHADCYPKLYYPELYVLEGGYKKFFQEHPTYCDPQAYVPMRDKRFNKEMKDSMSTVRRTQSKKALSQRTRSWSLSASSDGGPGGLESQSARLPRRAFCSQPDLTTLFRSGSTETIKGASSGLKKMKRKVTKTKKSRETGEEQQMEGEGKGKKNKSSIIRRPSLLLARLEEEVERIRREEEEEDEDEDTVA